MKRVLTSKTNSKSIVLVCFLLFAQTSLLFAADEITGLWEVEMDFGGRQTFAELTVSKNPDGSFSATWGSDELTDVKFQDGKLTFVRTVGTGDRQFTSNFEAALDKGKLTGKMISDRGENSLVCTRPKPMCPALGQWKMKISLGERDIDAVMTISKNAEGTLQGQWTKEPGEHKISDVNFSDGKLTFNRKVKLEDFEFETPFVGTVEGDKLSGTMKNEMGQWQITGSRIGIELIGKWELTTTSDRGTRTRILTIYPDLSGRYDFFGGLIPIKDLELEGDQVTFTIDMSFGDREFQMDFKGTLKDESLTGQFDSPRGQQDVTGKKLPEKTTTEAPPPKD